VRADFGRRENLIQTTPKMTSTREMMTSTSKKIISTTAKMTSTVEKMISIFAKTSSGSERSPLPISYDSCEDYELLNEISASGQALNDGERASVVHKNRTQYFLDVQRIGRCNRNGYIRVKEKRSNISGGCPNRYGAHQF